MLPKDEIISTLQAKTQLTFPEIAAVNNDLDLFCLLENIYNRLFYSLKERFGYVLPLSWFLVRFAAIGTGYLLWGLPF